MDDAARMPPPGAGTTDDAALIAAVRAGDRVQFATFFHVYYGALVRFARSITRSDESAEEVVNDVFARLWANHVTWAPHGTVRAYIFRAVRNRAIDAADANSAMVRALSRVLRWQSRERPTAMGKPAPAPDETLVLRETRAALHDAIATLPEQTRQILALRWQHGMSWTEVAEVTGMDSAAVRMKHTRALRALRDKLAPHFE